MPDPAVIGLVGTGLRDHPAVRAWRSLRPEHVEPAAIEIIKGRPPARLRGKSFVCRLAGVGPSGADVIAKRCRLEKSTLEHAVHVLLARLPVSALRCHGLAPEPDGPCGWLFLEDAGGEPCDPNAPAHRELVARWLGRLHAAGSGLAADLPDRGPPHFRAHLESARAGLRRCMDNPALGAGDVPVLEELDALCAAIASRWRRVERACDAMPRTLVHGDLKPANMRVRPAVGAPRLLCLDWETAGWGPPAVDLSGVDLDRYRHAVRPAWPDLDPPRARRWAGTGVLFRHLAAIDWETERLALEWVRRPMRRMRGFARGLAACLRTLEDEE